MIVMNGWKLAPHCWRTFLLRPFRVDRAPPRWVCVSLCGFVFFFEERRA